MTHALLLSPDDQAVSAITGVLEEMSVTCERPLDGVSAAQKLNSQSFDLVLVDCENLPAAKLIFDVCKRGKGGNNPVPIAIVDGRAGLPTAFRLGAELILTKPVSKDQARTTIRTAVSRVRKENAVEQLTTSLGHPQSTVMEGEDQSLSMGAAMTGTGIPLDFSAATDVSERVAVQLTSYSEPAPDTAPALDSAPPVKPPVAAAASQPVSAKTAAYMKEARSEEEKPAVRPLPSSPTPLKTSSTPAPKAAIVMKPSDDPVLAELEQAEQAELEGHQKRAELAKSARISSEMAASAQSGHGHSATSLATDSVHDPGHARRNGMLVGTLMLALAGGGFYAVWNYQPGFKAMANAEISRASKMFGISSPAVSTAKVVNAPAAVAYESPAKNANDQTQSSATPSVINSTSGNGAADATSVSTGSVPAATAEESASQSAIKTAQPESKAASDTSGKTESVKVATSDSLDLANSKRESDMASPVASEKNALVLSSQGAQKRLIYSVQPKYSAEARARGSQDSIVLKTFVKSDGNVADVRLVEGNSALAPAAINAVKQWRYRPLQREGKAQPFQTVVIVDSPKQ